MIPEKMENTVKTTGFYFAMSSSSDIRSLNPTMFFSSVTVTATNNVACFANKGLSKAIKCYKFAFNVILYCTHSFAEAINQILSPKWSFF